MIHLASPRLLAVFIVGAAVAYTAYWLYGWLGLEIALFPLGRLMAGQLTAPEFVRGSAGPLLSLGMWAEYFWVYVFAGAIGFSTTIAEPALMAVAIKANQVSGGTITVRGLRVAVALGVAAGVAMGAFAGLLSAPRWSGWRCGQGPIATRGSPSSENTASTSRPRPRCKRARAPRGRSPWPGRPADDRSAMPLHRLGTRRRILPVRGIPGTRRGPVVSMPAKLAKTA